MRVLVVDQDSTQLTAITRLLGEYFAIDAVTTKADCLDLLRVNEFDVIVAGERLEDGSGLELLSQIARSCPDILRIFAADSERLKLLKGRLGPFKLFRTLYYPIEPRQLLAALSAAAAIVEEDEQQPEEEESFEAEFEAPPPAPRQVAAPAQSRATAPSRRPTAAPRPAARAAPQLEIPTRVSAVTTAANIVPADVTVQKARARTPPAPPAQPPVATQPRQARQPTPEVLALGSRLAANSRARPKGFAPPSLEASAQRSAFAVGAGVALVIGSLVLALRIFSPPHAPTNLSGPQPLTFPPEVLKLVADTETAFQLDDLKAARTDIAALQQLAPTHPGLPFFESELTRRVQEAAAAKMPNPSAAAAKRATLTEAASPPRVPHIPRTPPKKPTSVATFSGRTLEDTSSSAGSGNAGPIPTADLAHPSPVSLAHTAAKVVLEPHLIERVAPAYPDDAARNGIEGAVDLSFAIGPRGDVRDVTVVHSEPSNIFNRAAIAAVRRWKYEPKTVDGVPVETRAQLRLTFKLDRQAH